jgi:hypothetical protein
LLYCIHCFFAAVEGEILTITTFTDNNVVKVTVINRLKKENSPFNISSVSSKYKSVSAPLRLFPELLDVAVTLTTLLSVNVVIVNISPSTAAKKQ